jgi:hypothetical protein
VTWVEAASDRRTLKAIAYESLFRPEFKEVFDTWLATEPLLDDGSFATSPLNRPDYDAREDEQEANALLNEARAEGRESEEAARRSSDYSFLVVMFAGTLVFVTMSGRLPRRSLRLMTLGMAGVLLFAGVAWLATLPVRVGL